MRWCQELCMQSQHARTVPYQDTAAAEDSNVAMKPPQRSRYNW